MREKYGREWAQKAEADEWRSYRALEDAARRETPVPDAPLKRTWHETAFRRAVAWAVEHGYDSVTWATGDMNAALFEKQGDATNAKSASVIAQGLKTPPNERRGGNFGQNLINVVGGLLQMFLVR